MFIVTTHHNDVNNSYNQANNCGNNHSRSTHYSSSHECSSNHFNANHY